MKPRTKTISTKVTDEEFVRLEELATASGQSMSEWSRQVLLERLNAIQASPTEEIVLAEILALRNILVNLAHAQNQGERLSLEQIHQLLTEADQIKSRKAVERLGARGKAESDGLSGTE